jgi:hypothetical protein
MYTTVLTSPTVAGSPYTVVHNLNLSPAYPLVDLWDVVTGQKMEADVQTIDNNTISVTFRQNALHNVQVVVAGGVPTSGTAQVLAYRYAQGSASTVWSITHNLTFRPNVSVVDSSGTQIFPGAVKYLSDTQVELDFSSAVGGEAYLS